MAIGFVQKLKKKLGRYFLQRDGDVKRRRRGSNFSTANHVAILYKDEDEQFFKQIKAYVKYLHEEHGIRKVMAFGFIDTDEKNIPIWHAHKLKFDYFTRADLNWHLKPSTAVQTFTDQEFDILIDLSDEDCVPLRWVLAHSQAKMKVGRQGNTHDKDYDLLIDVETDERKDKFIEQVNFYLSNLTIQ